MKLEFLADGSRDCPLIRLYEFTPAEAASFRDSVNGLATGTVVRIDVHRLAYVTAIGGCRLSLVLKQWDQAVVRRARPAGFECGFTAITWDNVVGLLEPFTERVDRFQWLAGSPGEAQLVFGEW
jgi:hypothetical protein